MAGTRLLTAIVGIPILLVVLFAGQPWLTLLIALLVTAAAVEMSGLLARAGYPVEPAVMGLLALLGVASAVSWELASAELLPAGWLIVLVLGGALSAIMLAEPAAGLRRWLATVAGVLIVTMLVFLLRICLGARPDSASGSLLQYLDAGRIWLIFTVFCVWACDVAAYVVGSRWPRGHFFAHISPRKTWSGFVGGAIGAIVVGLLLGLVVDRPLIGLGLGVVVGLIAPIGDLGESMLKRAAGVKDSGRLFPGHGGLLDRVDSFLAVAPVAWLFFVAVGVV